MSIWFTEDNFGSVRYGYKVNEILWRYQSPFQLIEIVETEAFGTMMLLDGLIMITDVDEFVYHEMIAHIPACLHGQARKVLVIGGGDGGTVRELLKYPDINEITLCEIDGGVIEAAKKFFPDVACGFYDARVNVLVDDGIKFVQEQKAESFDLVLVDSTDPIGPGEGLFTKEFYRNVARILTRDGLMAAQSESPWYDQSTLNRIRTNVSAGFSHVKNYWGAVPTYPRGCWSWTIAGQKQIDPQNTNRKLFQKINTDLKYLNEDLLTAAFALPNFYRDKLRER